MPIRITGMNSGLDTESIIAELVKAQKTKVDTLKKKQTKHEWKQDAWKELNTKIKKFYDGTLSNMRYESDYRKKTTKVSNSSAVSVITGANAINGSQKLKVKKVATTAYMTSAKLSQYSDGNTQLSKLGINGDSTIKVTTPGGDKTININGDMTIAGLVDQFRNAGLNANFDVDSQRFYISGSQSGAAGDFSFEFSDPNAQLKLGLSTSTAKTEADLQAELAEYQAWYGNQDNIDAEIASRAARYVSLRDSATAKIADLEAKKQAMEDADGDEKYDPSRTSEGIKEDIEKEKAKLEDETLTQADKDIINEQIEKLNKELALAEEYEGYEAEIGAQNTVIADCDKYVDASGNATTDLEKEVSDKFTADLAEITDVINQRIEDVRNGKTLNIGHMTKGEDAVIELNGAEFTSSNNVFNINGLTITALEETDEAVTITTSEDTDGIYDMIKNFIKEYSTLINEMDKLYNADSAKDYEPLTDEEKEAMSEKEVEKWEQKIKDSVLRRDSTLSTVSSALKEIMMGGVEVNGKKMYLSDFGIETLGYWNAADNEKNAYHINGDEDDEFTKNNTDKLRAAIANDPDSVVAFFTGLSKSLWGKVNTLMTKTDYSSSFTVYEDVRMKEEYDAYSEKIKKQEDKITALEDKWYKKFSAMETALAKMQSNQSAVTSLLGG